MQSTGRALHRLAKVRRGFIVSALLAAALSGGQVFASLVTARPRGLGLGKRATEAETATEEEFKPSGTALSQRLRTRLAKEIAAQETQVQAVPTEDQKRIVQQDVDLNGIDPVTCIFGSIPTAGLSWGFWEFTGKAAEWFVNHPVETDFYPAQRFNFVFQAAVVGLSSLAAGIFGFTALGIFLLGLRVSFGALTGELDPSKQNETRTEKLSTAETVFGVLTKDPLEVVAAEKERKAAEKLRNGTP
mmetsp:Transcript_23418/g.42274  ORF Transcript_23418/g.42274 Transcript_23418/m.42274 type:complete len:245 (-) Transcript_23418:57-791(-)